MAESQNSPICIIKEIRVEEHKSDVNFRPQVYIYLSSSKRFQIELSLSCTLSSIKRGNSLNKHQFWTAWPPSLSALSLMSHGLLSASAPTYWNLLIILFNCSYKKYFSFFTKCLTIKAKSRATTPSKRSWPRHGGNPGWHMWKFLSLLKTDVVNYWQSDHSLASIVQLWLMTKHFNEVVLSARLRPGCYRIADVAICMHASDRATARTAQRPRRRCW